MPHNHDRQELLEMGEIALLVLVLERLDALETTINEGFSNMALQVSDILKGEQYLRPSPPALTRSSPPSPSRRTSSPFTTR